MDAGTAPAALGRQFIAKRTFRPRVSERVVSILTAGTDALVVLLVGAGVYWSYVGWGAATYQKYFVALAVYTLLNGLAFNRARLYDTANLVSWPMQLRRCVAVNAVVLMFLVALAYAFKISSEFSRVWFFSTGMLSTALICFGRGIVKELVERYTPAGLLARNVAIIGAGGHARRWLVQFRHRNSPWNRIIGVFDDRMSRIDSQVEGYPVLGNFGDLVRLVQRGQIQDVVIALPWSADQRLQDIIANLRELPVHVYLASERIGNHLVPEERLSPDWAPAFEVVSMPLSGWGGVVKLIEDKVLATVLLILLSPLMASIALAVKLSSPGPALFHQKRCGFNNKGIVVYKFRTMFWPTGPQDESVQAVENDCRVIPFVGRFLRCTSLDELPQLFNVIEGTMSLVGPRPHIYELNERFEALIGDYHGRHKVKPGITGWAQVNDLRGETDTVEKMRARIEYDIFYVEHWSLWLDLWILLKTAFVFWRHQNAY